MLYEVNDRRNKLQKRLKQIFQNGGRSMRIISTTIICTDVRFRTPFGSSFMQWNKWNFQSVNFCRCSVHSEIYTVHSPTNMLFIKLRKV